MALINSLRFCLALPIFGLGLLCFKIAAVIGTEENALRMGDWFLANAPKRVRSP